ncbi:MAG: myristoyl transferase, partial [Oscillochloris sp.]|nr:myristoyl transferase [Oscillochloris sp.]
GKACPGYNDVAAWQSEADLLGKLAILSQPADVAGALRSLYVSEYYQQQNIICEMP